MSMYQLRVTQAHAGELAATSLLQGQKTVEFKSTMFAGKCIDARLGSTADQTPVQMYDCLRNVNQTWTVVPISTNLVNIKFKDKCLDVMWGASANGTKVWLWQCTGNFAQEWQPLANNVFKNPHSGRCLDGESGTNLTQLKIWDCNGLKYQSWTITDLTPAVPTTAPALQPTVVPQVNTAIVTPTPDTSADLLPTVPPSATTIPLTLQLHGLGNGGAGASIASADDFTPKRPQRRVTVQIFDLNNNLLASGLASVQYDPLTGLFKGNVDLGKAMPAGAAVMVVKADQFLAARIPLGTTISDENSPIALTNGDVNNDNIINIQDYHDLMGCYSDLSAPVDCLSGFQTKSDLNDDGAVNMFDYNLFLRELAKN